MVPDLLRRCRRRTTRGCRGVRPEHSGRLPPSSIFSGTGQSERRGWTSEQIIYYARAPVHRWCISNQARPTGRIPRAAPPAIHPSPPPAEPSSTRLLPSAREQSTSFPRTKSLPTLRAYSERTAHCERAAHSEWTERWGRRRLCTQYLRRAPNQGWCRRATTITNWGRELRLRPEPSGRIPTPVPSATRHSERNERAERRERDDLLLQ